MGHLGYPIKRNNSNEWMNEWVKVTKNDDSCARVILDWTKSATHALGYQFIKKKILF